MLIYHTSTEVPAPDSKDVSQHATQDDMKNEPEYQSVHKPWFKRTLTRISKSKHQNECASANIMRSGSERQKKDKGDKGKGKGKGKGSV